MADHASVYTYINDCAWTVLINVDNTDDLTMIKSLQQNQTKLDSHTRSLV